MSSAKPSRSRSRSPAQHHGAFAGSIVRIAGDPVLAAKAAAVTAEELRGKGNDGHEGPGGWKRGAIAEEWVDQMLQGLKETRGACIAAPQVGTSKRIIIMSIPEERIREEKQLLGDLPVSTVMPPVVLVNPEFWSLRGDAQEPKSEVWESCLSVPGQKVIVQRFDAVRYRAQRLDGAVVEGELQGRAGLTLQHEVDHLDGVLMTDRRSRTELREDEQIRIDGLGPVTSTKHWDLMQSPNYSLRTATFPGARLVGEPLEL